MCVCACERACVRACVCVCVCALCRHSTVPVRHWDPDVCGQHGKTQAGWFPGCATPSDEHPRRLAILVETDTRGISYSLHWMQASLTGSPPHPDLTRRPPPPPGLPLHTAYTRKSCLGIRSRPAVERRVVLEERFQKVFESGWGRMMSIPIRDFVPCTRALKTDWTELRFQKRFESGWGTIMSNPTRDFVPWTRALKTDWTELC